MMSDLAEQQLLADIRHGDQAALGQLLHRYQTRLYNVCLRMLGRHEEAEDATQEALLHVIEHIRQFKGRSSLSTWMIRIAMNVSISQLRRRKVRRAVSLEDCGDGSVQEDQASALRQHLADGREPQPHQRVEHDEMAHQLEHALAALEEPFRAILILRDIEQMDYQQIADVLDLPSGTVKSRLFRARLALRQKMTGARAAGPAASGEHLRQAGGEL
jgi:RNA polymerase sigma-70 factor (ECF subfamily)